MVDKNLLEVRNLKKYFSDIALRSFSGTKFSVVKAVDGVSFNIRHGETLGLVGETGSGKSTVGRTVLRLVEATSGEVFFKGKKLLKLPAEELRNIRKEMQMVFQDPYGSLNPKMTIQRILEEPFRIHQLLDVRSFKDRALETLSKVGLPPEYGERYPHEFSGGQRQRIGIARAIALNPDLIIADEPVSALDVSIQAQIINLLQDLKESMGISYLFISHDMEVVEHFCDRVAVMYFGKIVELASSEDIYQRTSHPYTKALLSAVPNLKGKLPQAMVGGDVPSPANLPSGCAFSGRCPIKEKVCDESDPPLTEVAPGHFAACHLIG
jgi:oligopeptide transport system ATP-binding protein